MKDRTLHLAALALCVCAALGFASPASAQPKLKLLNYRAIGWDDAGFNNFAKTVVNELKAQMPTLQVELVTAYQHDVGDNQLRCQQPDLCLVFDPTAIRDLRTTEGTTVGGRTFPRTSIGGTSSVYVEVVREKARQLDQKLWGPSFGLLMKLAVLHELGHQTGIVGDYFTPGYIMSDTLTPDSIKWRGDEIDKMKGFLNLIPIAVCWQPPCGSPDGSAGGGGLNEELATFFSGFESSDPPLSWPLRTVEYAVNVTSMWAYPWAAPDNRIIHSGNSSMNVLGNDRSAEQSYEYIKMFDVDVPVTENTYLSYAVWPFSETSKSVTIDLVFTDGTTLRDSFVVDQWGVALHPAAQGYNPNLSLGAWNVVEAELGPRCAGRMIDRILVAYDRPADTGSFHAWIDDIAIAHR
jgi:hypothetical protein